MRSALLMLALLLSCLCSAETICIDPGHPSENGVGAHGKHISEVHAAWVVALKLKKLLTEAGYKVVMTKQAENEKVTNKRRAEIANAAKADLMVRLHCDAGNASGIATYYPGVQGKVGKVVGPSKAVLAASREMALKFHPHVAFALDGLLKDRGVHTEAATHIGSKQGALTGSIYSKVPVVLVEMAVLQNDHDDRFIASEQGQEKIAAALKAGIDNAIYNQP